MDPTENLRRQRELAKQIVSILDNTGDEGLSELEELDVIDFANELAELVQGLDQWLSRGGFLPADWKRANEL